MAKPTADVHWAESRVGDPDFMVEPADALKTAGYDVGAKPPAQWLNWQLWALWQWVLWLAAYESTSHVWTAEQDFNGPAGQGNIVIGAGTWQGNGCLEANGSFNLPAVYAKAGNAVGAVAIDAYGETASSGGGNFGNNALRGTGGNGKLLGGSGAAAIGGNATASGGTGGTGGFAIGGAGATTGAGTGGVGFNITGGAIDGTTNTAGAAGVGATVVGGAVTSDANGRKGGVALQLTGGSGQAGYGHALELLHGDVAIDDGNILQGGGTGNVLVDTEIDGTLAVNSTSTFAGQIAANGGIALEAAHNVTGGVGFVNSWGDATGLGGDTVAYWKDPFGMIHLRGSAVGGTSGTVAFTLPVGYRPATHIYQRSVQVANASDANVAIATSGAVTLSFTGGNSSVSLDGIIFR